MAITTPDIYTPVHREEVLFQESFTEETIRKIVRNGNFLIDLVPLRTVVFVEVNQNGVPPLDLGVWQECNGSEITNPNSPLRTIGAEARFVPDLRDRYIRGATNPISGNLQAGSNHHNLTHNHTGFTEDTNQSPLNYDASGDRHIRISHVHAIASQLGSSEFFDCPAYMYVIAYMRVA